MQQVLNTVKVDQKLSVRHSDAVSKNTSGKKFEKMLSEVSLESGIC